METTIIEKQIKMLDEGIDGLLLHGGKMAEIILQLLIYIDQRRWNFHPRLYTKTKPMCLSHIVVRVLSDNYYLYLRKRCQMQRRKNLIRRRVHHHLRILFLYKLIEMSNLPMLVLRILSD